MRKTCSPLTLRRQNVRILSAPYLRGVAGGDGVAPPAKASGDLPGADTDKCTNTIATSEGCSKWVKC